MEVSKEDYTEFYRAKRRQKYLDERSADNGDFSYDMLTTDEFSGEDILIAEQPDVCDTVVESIMTDKLKEAIDVEAVKADLAGKKAVKLIVDSAVPVEEKKPAKKTAKKAAEKAE